MYPTVLFKAERTSTQEFQLMHALSTLALARIGLIVIGLIFQVIAMSWLYRDSSHERSDAEEHDWGGHNFDLGRQRRKAARGLPRHTVHDYYEMEKTPPGVRPADLRKTARVIYMDGAAKPPPGL
jgi:hypothetical protein